MNLIGRCIAGAIAGVVLRFFVDDFWTVNEVGWIERTLSKKFTSIPFWAVSGAALAGSSEIIRWAWRKDHATALRKWAIRHQFQYRDEKDGLDGVHRLRVFKNRYEQRNHLAGTMGNISVEMVDLTTIHRGSDDEKTYTHQSVVILRDSATNLPEFELRPHGLGTRVLEFISKTGIEFSGEHLRPHETSVVARFNRKYLLIPQGSHAPNPAEENTDSSESSPIDALRSVFTIDLLQLLAENPSWCVESRHGHLAFWKTKKVVSAARRKHLLDTIQVLYKGLVPDRPVEPTRGLELQHVTTIDRGARRNNLHFVVVGVFIGFFAGGLTSMCVFSTLADRSHPLTFFGSFFVPIIAGTVIGALVGTKIAVSR